jgi:hypothetical protein
MIHRMIGEPLLAPRVHVVVAGARFADTLQRRAVHSVVVVSPEGVCAALVLSSVSL